MAELKLNWCCLQLMWVCVCTCLYWLYSSSQCSLFLKYLIELIEETSSFQSNVETIPWHGSTRNEILFQSHCIKAVWLTHCWVFFIFTTARSNTWCKNAMPYTAIFHSDQGIVSSVNRPTHTICKTCGGILYVMVSESWLGLAAHVWLLPEALKRRQQGSHNTGLNNSQHIEVLKSHTWLTDTGNQAWNMLLKIHAGFCHMKRLKKKLHASAFGLYLSVSLSIKSSKYKNILDMSRMCLKHV